MIDVPEHRSLHPLGSLRQLRADPLGFYCGLRERYGDFVRFRLGPHRVTLVSDPRAAQQILLGDGRRFGKGLGNDAMAPVLRQALFLREGEAWARTRRILKPHYGPEAIPGYLDEVWAEGRALARRLARGGGGALYPAVRDAVVTLSARLLLGDASLVGPAQRAALDGLWLDLAWRQDPLRRLLAGPRNLRYRRRLAVVRDLLERAVAQARAEAEPTSLLGWLARATDPQTSEGATGLELPALLGEAATLVFSAQECAAIATAWALWRLAEEPDGQRALRDSLRPQPPATARELLAQPGLRNALYEALRLYPPAWLLSRAAIGDQDVEGRRLPAGDSVFISPYVLGRHPAHWADPECFRPTRFDGQVDRRAYLPFGAGPRTCLGMRLALTMSVAILHAVVTHVRLRPGTGPRSPRPGLTLRPDDALCVEVRIHETGR